MTALTLQVAQRIAPDVLRNPAMPWRRPCGDQPPNREHRPRHHMPPTARRNTPPLAFPPHTRIAGHLKNSER